MSSPNHPTSDIEDAFSSNFMNYIPASPDYFLASPGNTSSESSNNSSGLVPIASPTLSHFHNDPYMKVIQAYNAISPPQVTIPPPTIVPPSLVLSLSPMFDSRDFFPPEEIPPPKDNETPIESPIPISPSSSLVRIVSITKEQQQALDDVLVPREQCLQIGSCNYRLSTMFKPKEPTFQVALDVLSLTPFYPAVLITASVPAIYMHEFWTSASYHKHSIRFKLNTKRYSFDLDTFRNIL
ncbi:hypothetical protein Tco_1163629 [Tanacetum coccineum]